MLCRVLLDSDTLLTGMEIPVNIGTCRFEYAEPSGVAPPTTKRVSELTVSLFAATFLITFLAALQAVGKQEIILLLTLRQKV